MFVGVRPCDFCTYVEIISAPCTTWRAKAVGANLMAALRSIPGHSREIARTCRPRQDFLFLERVGRQDA